MRSSRAARTQGWRDVRNLQVAQILLLCNALAVACCVWRCSVRRGLMQVDHVVLYSIGFVGYWLMPIAVGSIGYLRETREMRPWFVLYDAVPSGTIVLYLVLCFLTYLSFIFGHVVCGRVAARPVSPRRLWEFSPNLLNLLFLPALAIATAFTVSLRSELFVGYQGSIYEDFGWRGSFTASTLALLAIAIIDVVQREHRQGRAPSALAILTNRFVLGYLVFGVLLLSMGARLYFATSLLMYIVYRSVFHRRIPVSRVIALGVVMATLAGVVGVVRLGGSTTVTQLVINLFSEFLYTSFSLINFLQTGTMELVNVPKFLVSDFINLIPTVLLPNKAALLLNPNDYGYSVYMPFGALHSFFSFTINFGVLGTLPVMFAFGYGLRWLQINGHLVLLRTLYVMLSSWMAFTFFRDPFATSIVKNMFEFSVLVPTMIIVALHVATVATRRAGPAVVAATGQGGA
jgi:hypothetical protein